MRQLFVRDLYPRLAARPIAEIEAPELLQIIQKIEARGALDTAHRALQNAGAVFRCAVATRRAKRDPSQDLKGALQPVKGEHVAAVIDPTELGELLRAIDSYQGKGQSVVGYALKMLAYTFPRPAELRFACWSEIDLEAENTVWRLPAKRTKMKDSHVIPLAPQMVELLEELRPISGKQMLFPSTRHGGRPISDGTLSAALSAMGFDGKTHAKHVARGFRATASTLLNELGYAPELIELSLAHKERKQIRAAYKRAQRLPERRVLIHGGATATDR